MKIRTQKTTWTIIGVAAGLLSGTAVADDTELLLINPDPSQNPKPLRLKSKPWSRPHPRKRIRFLCRTPS